MTGVQSRVFADDCRFRRVCVTGGAGMIGRRLVASLVRSGIDVSVFDNLCAGTTMPTGAGAICHGDIRDETVLGTFLRDVRPDALVHLAALHHIPTCEAQGALCFDINVTGTERVLATAAQAGIQHVVLASSGAVYGWASGALSEDLTPTDPRDNYAVSKLCNEHQLRLWCARTGGRGHVARIFNAIAGDDTNAHLIPDLLAQLRASQGGSALVRLGNLVSRRDYLHADEVAEGIAAMLAHDGPAAFDIFNLASGEEHSVEAVVACLAQCLKRSVHIEVDATRRRKVDRPSQLGDPSKALKRLGWQTRLTFQEVLDRMLSERVNNPACP